MSLIIFLLCRQTGMKSSTKSPRYYFHPEIKAVNAASERQYTATGGEAQVPWNGIHE